jgi:PHS family inorganic phosphate transporter-like MFS transporter
MALKNHHLTRSSPFEAVDDTRLSFNHIKIWFTSGMGFFTDAYDLFIIGVALIIFGAYSLPGFTMSTSVLGLPAAGFIGASAIFAAVIGQLIFGFLADRIGRKTVYGVEAMILALGAILSALSPNLYWLIIFRFIEGIGIGGDYPVSATIMSEYSNVKDRGKLNMAPARPFFPNCILKLSMKLNSRKKERSTLKPMV